MREREHLRLQSKCGNVFDGSAVRLGDGGHAGFDAMHAEGVELTGDRHLLFTAENCVIIH